MRAALVALLITLPRFVLAADGDPASVTVPQYTSLTGVPTCIDICKAKTTATDCGPVWAPIQNASHVTIKVTNAVDVGAAVCKWDDWGVYENNKNTTPSATNTFGALCAIDDDTTSSVVGAAVGAECKIFGPVGPWVFIDAGTLTDNATTGNCVNFTVTGCWWPPVSKP